MQSFLSLALFRISNFATIFEVDFISHIKFCELLFIIIPNRPFSEGFKIVKPFPNQLELGQNHRTHYSLHVPPLKQFEQGLSSLTHIHRTITATVYSFVKEELRLQEHGQTGWFLYTPTQLIFSGCMITCHSFKQYLKLQTQSEKNQ